MRLPDYRTIAGSIARHMMTHPEMTYTPSRASRRRGAPFNKGRPRAEWTLPRDDPVPLCRICALAGPGNDVCAHPAEEDDILDDDC